MFMGTKMIGLAVIGTLISCGLAQADMVGVNFGTAIGDGVTAGVSPATQINWNNVPVSGAASGTLTSLKDNGGDSVAGLSVNYSCNWVQSGRTGGFSGGDVSLYTTYLGSSGTRAAITVTNVPYARYDIIAYVTGNDTYNRAGAVTLSNVSPETGGLDSTNRYFFRVSNSGGYNQATQTTPPANSLTASQYTYANYVLFTGNTADGFKIAITDNMVAWNVDVGFAGFQIIDTTPAPEPASLVIMLGGASLILARRKKA